MSGVAIHINPLQTHAIASKPASPAPVKSANTEPFSAMLSSIASNKPSQRTSAGSGTTSTATTTTSSGPNAISLFDNPAVDAMPATVSTSSDGTSLANLMAAASYAGVPYADLSAQFNGTCNGSYDPSWQQKLANALEARLQSVAGSGTANQIYDPNPANDSVPIDLTNTKQFTSSASEIQGLLNNMWSAVHAGDVNGYHNALQQVDTWYQSNGQQNYYTGLTDGEVAAFNPATRTLGVNMPNANATVAAAELAAITGKAAAVTNLASIAQSALTGNIST